jgi:hypothetical protein
VEVSSIDSEKTAKGLRIKDNARDSREVGEDVVQF